MILQECNTAIENLEKLSMILILDDDFCVKKKYNTANKYLGMVSSFLHDLRNNQTNERLMIAMELYAEGLVDLKKGSEIASVPILDFTKCLNEFGIKCVKDNVEKFSQANNCFLFLKVCMLDFLTYFDECEEEFDEKAKVIHCLNILNEFFKEEGCE
mgnify:CR=1 FL=1